MPDSLSFLPVADFRNEIDFAYEAIQCHWPACVGEQEKVYWFIGAMKRFNRLNGLGCKRAAVEDRKRFDEVFDLFSMHTNEHYDIWMKARLELGAITLEQYQAVMLIESKSAS